MEILHSLVPDVPDVLGSNPTHQFLLCISACVHPVYILRVIINVRCSLIKKSEWSSGNTTLSWSRGTGFKSHSQFLLFISAFVHPVSFLRVIINSWYLYSLLISFVWSQGLLLTLLFLSSSFVFHFTPD